MYKGIVIACILLRYSKIIKLDHVEFLSISSDLETIYTSPRTSTDILRSMDICLDIILTLILHMHTSLIGDSFVVSEYFKTYSQLLLQL